MQMITMKIPKFLTPWIDRFFTPEEMLLINILQSGPMKKASLVKHLAAENKLIMGTALDDFLQACWKRGVINHLEDGRVMLTDFHVRFDYWALFEGWKDLPQKTRDQLNQWELDHYINSHAGKALELKHKDTRSPNHIYPEYVLLHEVEALFTKIEQFFLWPCNCRAMMGLCRQSEYTCIRFSNSRGIGWEISREKALFIVNQANKRGLMQSSEIGIDGDGKITGALCNCCSDCCFPHQLSQKLGVEHYWPLRRYVAQTPDKNCNGCGRCIGRCPFGIITAPTINDTMRSVDSGKENRLPPVIDMDHCRGCGVCSTGCPQDAIHMKQVRESVFEDQFKF
ncbi:MAG: 4Fe-4S dicluster domain-containing protein [Desulfobacteraceae bacterium]|nr:MAG: 4Fe-4S dicluster domain-containing protein [Desulfobacteraceae bacterium]